MEWNCDVHGKRCETNCKRDSMDRKRFRDTRSSVENLLSVWGRGAAREVRSGSRGWCEDRDWRGTTKRGKLGGSRRSSRVFLSVVRVSPVSHLRECHIVSKHPPSCKAQQERRETATGREGVWSRARLCVLCPLCTVSLSLSLFLSLSRVFIRRPANDGENVHIHPVAVRLLL